MCQNEEHMFAQYSSKLAPKYFLIQKILPVVENWEKKVFPTTFLFFPCFKEKVFVMSFFIKNLLWKFGKYEKSFRLYYVG